MRTLSEAPQEAQSDVGELLLQRMRQSLRVVGGESWFVVRPNLFAIPHLDGYLLYSPLQGLVVLITRAGLAALLLRPAESVASCLRECVVERDSRMLELFDTHPEQHPATESEAAWEFRPVSVTLSPTAACQLACTYCYIRGGDNPRHLPWEIAEVAIRFTAENAQSRGLSHFDVEFHGQGEPTANWPLFRDAVLFAEGQCASRSLEPRFSVVTNGILTEEKVAFLADHRVRVGLSMDGFQASTDLQRPLRGGGSTFARIMQTIRRFAERGVDFAIRSTVTEANIGEMTEFVSFVKSETHCRYINFEPVCGVGRARDHNLDGAGLMPQFVAKFLDARGRGLQDGVEIGYSACRVDGLRSSFCGAYGSNLNFCVSTEGLVSSCYEVLEESDPRAEIFIYGRYDAAARRFTFDEDRLGRLLTLNVTKMGRCQDCYVKWNCGGDCLSKAALGGIEHLTDDAPLERCSANRIITKDELAGSLLKIVRKMN